MSFIIANYAYTHQGHVIVLDEDIVAKDDGTLYHTDLTSTEEKWKETHPYVFWKTNDAVHRRLWTEKSQIEATLAERWAADMVPFRIIRDGKWMTPQEVKEKE